MIRQPCDEAAIRSAPAGHPCSPNLGLWVLAASILGSSMAFIDGSVVNVVLPILQTELEADLVQAQWIVESYALFLAALLLVGGALGDRYGRRLIFAIGVAVFAAASAFCGMSDSPEQLIWARALQGMGGALLIPGSLALISAFFSQEQRGRAIGIWSAFTAVTAALGPVMGGWLAETVSWRWIFYVNLPLAAAILAILFLRVPESRNESAPPHLDWKGALLAPLGLGLFVYGLLESALLGLGHPLVLGSVVGGIAILALFLRVEARSASAMMPLGLFRSRRFSGANLLTLFLYAGLNGALFFLPFNLIQVQGYTPTAAGAAFLPVILLIFLLSRAFGGMADRYGARPLLTAGPAIAAAGFLLLALPGIGGSYWSTFFPGMVVLGLGMAVSVAPLTTAVMTSVSDDMAGVASGVNNAVSRTAALLAIALLGVLVLGLFNQGLDSRLSALDLPPGALEEIDSQRVRLAAAEAPQELDAGLADAVARIIDESFVAGFRGLMVAAAGLSLLGSLCALALMRERV